MAHLYLAESLVDVEPGATVSIEGAEARHAVSVNRLRPGDPLAIGNGAGMIVTGTVVVAAPERLSIVAEEVVLHAAPSPTITLVQALAKGGRDEAAVQAATELGVDTLVPWSARRSVVRWDAAKRVKGVSRWQSIVREASKQSIRPHVPRVHELESTAEVVRRASRARMLVLEPGAATPLTAIVADDRDLVLVIGPEGGIDERELAQFTAAGAELVRLGAEVLRTSTAGPAAIAIVNAGLGRW